MSWTNHWVGELIQLEGIAWLQGLYIAVGLTGQAYTSTNGIEWIEHPDSSLRMFYGLAASGRFAVAAGWKGIRYVSADGAKWAPITLQAVRDLSSVAFGNGTCVAVGVGGTILQSDAILELALSAGPQPVLTVTGPRGMTCRIEETSALLDAGNWQTSLSLCLTNGDAVWKVPSAPGQNRFFRAVAP
jgi:hypothetical protein